MIQKKVCLLGAFGVGKTSLVSRFVHSIFSDKYLTTLGVKIEKKSIDVDGERVDLIIWDLHGEDALQRVDMSYLRGAAGYLLVVDGTRRATVDTAVSLHAGALRAVGEVPFVIAINKADLSNAWEVDDSGLKTLGCPVLRTSAKTGAEVETAFALLAREVIPR